MDDHGSHPLLIRFRAAICVLFLAVSAFALIGAGSPAVVGHRGAGIDVGVPENTLAAFERAINDGADWIELDVRLTADAVPVVLHDADLKYTTDCSGCAGDFTLAELRACRVVAAKGEPVGAEPVPTLAEVLDRLAGRIAVNVEVKPDRCDGSLAEDIVSPVAAELERLPDSTDVIVSSFAPEVVGLFESLRPEWITSLIVGEQDADEGIRTAVERHLDGVHVHHRGLTEGRMRRAHEAGLFVFAWTVNDPRRVRRMADLGADGIVTDRPGLIAALLETYTLPMLPAPDDDDDLEAEGAEADDDDSSDADPDETDGCAAEPDRFARY